MSNSSEVQNSDDLKKYISEPQELVGVTNKNSPYKAIRTSWLSSWKFVGTYISSHY